MRKNCREEGIDYVWLIEYMKNYPPLKAEPACETPGVWNRYLNKMSLLDGHIEMHNNIIERMFRHIAIGRRNWLHTGSHFAAGNIVFMYSLLESCKLNNVNFGEYIKDVLTRMMRGEKADASFLPNKYVPRMKEGSNKTAA